MTCVHHYDGIFMVLKNSLHKDLIVKMKLFLWTQKNTKIWLFNSKLKIFFTSFFPVLSTNSMCQTNVPMVLFIKQAFLMFEASPERSNNYNIFIIVSCSFSTPHSASLHFGEIVPGMLFSTLCCDLVQFWLKNSVWDQQCAHQDGWVAASTSPIKAFIKL